MLLASDLQQNDVTTEAAAGAEQMAERTLRAVAHAGAWAEQRAVREKLMSERVRETKRPCPKGGTSASSGGPFGPFDPFTGLFDSRPRLWAGLAPRTLQRCAGVLTPSESSR